MTSGMMYNNNNNNNKSAIAGMLAAAALMMFVCLASAQPNLLVYTDSGFVQGVNQDNLARAFLGIPFANPPERFAAAQPVTSWSPGTYNASTFPKPCVQSATLGVEDCLYLNVFTPLEAHTKSKLPVMVWIHGGRYWTGQSDQYVGKYLASQGEVILVTIQYRLNTFGFFALPELIAENNVNVGFLDQILAIEWVRANIANFGGDPYDITLFGESAGANAAMLHTMVHKYTDPTAYLGYAQNVILQSTWQWVMPTMEQTVAASLKWAAGKGCNQASSAEVLACMRALPASSVVSTSGLVNYFQPSVDGVFLKDQPYNLIKRGEYDTDINVVMGYNAVEGNYMAYTRSGFRPPSAALTSADYVRSVQTNSLGFWLTSAQMNDVFGWYADNTAEKGYWYGSADILGDFYVNCGSLLAVREFAKSVPTFTYIWNHTSANYPDQFLGAAHGNELPYIFNGTVYTKYASTYADLALTSRMLASWARIATKGKPDPSYWPKWKPTNEVAFLWEQADGNPYPDNTRTVPFSVESREFCAQWEQFFSANSLVQP